MKTGIQTLPPKMLQQYGERAQRMDGCVRVGEGDIFEFAGPGNTVVCIIGLPPVAGHFGKDAHRAAAIRAIIAAEPSP